MMQLRNAKLSDADAIAAVVNAAYQVENFFKYDERTDADEVRELMQQGEFLVCEESAQLQACIYVELRGTAGYFGLLAVDPAQQGKGLARLLITAAEDHCRAAGCGEMQLSIVNLREELPAFYGRFGYRADGIEPFTEGVPLKIPCHFVKMVKPL